MAAGIKILLVGSGGREHALALAVARSPLCSQLIVTPGNPGIEILGTRGVPGEVPPGKVRLCAVGVDDHAALLALVEQERVDLVVCGPEGPLVAGLGDLLRARGVKFFGPSQKAAEIEGSKAFAKEIMSRAGVPTAAHGSFDEVPAAEAFIEAQSGDVVVKADGLCAGKGVVVTSSHDEAKAAVRAMLGDRLFGTAGARVVIEERLQGRECSMLAFTDGKRFALLASSEDHKAVFDGDQGPNTGGMGAYSPSPLVDDATTAFIGERIFAPTIAAMAGVGREFRGLLYAGLMLTPDRGPMVIEFNARFGDPETQAVLARMEDDIVPWLLGSASGALPAGAPRFRSGTSLCVVLAAEGYPGKVRTGDEITGLPADGRFADGVVALHAGTRLADGRILTAGGRVLGVTGQGDDLAQARARVYAAVGAIHWPGMHFRTDIGLRGRTT